MILIGAFVALLADANAQEDAVIFANGDKLRGKILSIDPINGIAIKNQFIDQTTVFPFKSANKILIAENEQPKINGKYPCLIRMVNQDEFECNLVSIDEKDAIVETTFAGRLTIPRKRLDSLNPIMPDPTIIYKGPEGLEGWTISNSPIQEEQPSKWRYVNGAFITTGAGSVARDLKLPDIATIEFDITWQNYMSIAVALYASTLQPIPLAQKDDLPDFGSFYSMQISYNTANLMLIKKGLPLNSMGIAFIPNMERKNSAHVMIRINKPQKTILLYMDGVLIKQWQEPGEFGGSGTCVRFVNQLSSPLKLSNIIVSQWDGRIEAPQNKIDNAKSDFIRMINNDVVNGTIKEFKNGKFTVQTAFGNVETPLERIAQIHFSAIGREPPVKTDQEIHTTLQKHGKLSLKLEKWENNRLVASNPNFGKVSLPISALKIILLKPELPSLEF